jgi:hypothetical protein
MTGLVRKAILLGVCGLLAASAALANVPDPATSTVPSFVYVVGMLNSGNPDVDGADGPGGISNIIIIKDFAGNPISGVTVSIELPCDWKLCQTVVAGQTVDCPTGTLSGLTDPAGRFVFKLVGAARDNAPVPPGVYPAGIMCCGLNSTKVTVTGYAGTFKTTTAIGFDQDGGTLGPGTNGVTGGDVFKVINLVGGVGLAGPAWYKGRGDLNADGAISAADIFGEISNVGRLGLVGGVGCTAAFCAVRVACPF